MNKQERLDSVTVWIWCKTVPAKKKKKRERRDEDVRGGWRGHGTEEQEGNEEGSNEREGGRNVMSSSGLPSSANQREAKISFRLQLCCLCDITAGSRPIGMQPERQIQKVLTLTSVCQTVYYRNYDKTGSLRKDSPYFLAGIFSQVRS